MKITLASNSPRRKELLLLLDLKFKTLHPNVNEESIRHKDPKILTKLLAEAKAEAIKGRVGNGIIIGSDSVVVFNDQIIEKARDINHQRELIKSQRGKKAATVTSVCVINLHTGEKITRTKMTKYLVADFSDEQVETYIKSGHGLDEAGGFGVQDEKGLFLEEIYGCYTTVVGLPLCELTEILSKMGISYNNEFKEGIFNKTGHKC